MDAQEQLVIVRGAPAVKEKFYPCRKFRFNNNLYKIPNDLRIILSRDLQDENLQKLPLSKGKIAQLKKTSSTVSSTPFEVIRKDYKKLVSRDGAVRRAYENYVNFKTQSTIWSHFEISTLDNSKATCLYCKENVSRGTTSKSYNTSNLWIHMKRHHNSELDTASTSKQLLRKPRRRGGRSTTTTKETTTLSEIIDKKSLYVDDDVRAKDITLTIAEQICVDMEPFDLVNKIGFKD
ncbi:Zinc finger BED domain-containing protein 4 [Eumeta japonica]|uniref:Zinc finger BED domain-containing protein 4 n=1 Tax=Eumeta variegata TaxID=151549 RepID=A0A4C1Z6L5_EUMVA|nr:Zinc finger BED domain-containing protein 4 [Eumeta japonica]